MFEFLSNLDWALIAPQLIGQFFSVILGVIASWFLLFRKRWRALEDIQRGDTDIVLFQHHVLYPSDGKYVLLFRNSCPNTTTQQLYHNSAARDEARKLADETSLQDPILNARGAVGFEVVNGAFSQIAGHLAITPFPREKWLFAMTCEDRNLVKRRCIRCFLIREPDLDCFADWTWCRENVLCEKPWHWVRLVTLHRIAQQWKGSGPEDYRASEKIIMPAVDEGERYRIWELSAGVNTGDIPIGIPVEIPWGQHEETLRKLGLDVKTGEALNA